MLALVNDYEIVLAGLSRMIDGYGDRVVVADLAANEPLEDVVDIALYDSFAQPEADHDDVEVLIRSGHARKVVVYTWNFHEALVEAALHKGAHGYLSKTLTAKELVDALEAIHGGETVIGRPPAGRAPTARDWPGRAEGLTDRESEILCLITQGKSNAEIAALTFLSINSIKSYIRSAYRKIGVTSRTRAVLWGIHHGLQPDHHRIDTWRSG